MQIQHWLVVGGIAVSVALAFGAFYDRVINGRFQARDRELKKLWEEMKTINSRCIGHMENVGQVGADIANLKDSIQRIETKVDKILNGRIK